MRVIKENILTELSFNDTVEGLEKKIRDDYINSDFDLAHDGFACLYENNPKVDSKTEDLATLFAISELLDTEMFRGLKKRTTWRGTISMGVLPLLMKSLRERINAIQEEMQVKETPEEERDEDAIKRAAKRSVESEKRLLREIAKADEAAKAMSSFMEEMDWGDQEATEVFSYNNLENLSTRQDLLRIAEKAQLIMGQFCTIMNKTSWSLSKRGVNLKGVETGNDISRLYPASAITLVDPDLELLFFRDFVERRLMLYSLEPRKIYEEDKGKGNVLLLVDISGSMELNEKHLDVKGMTIVLRKLLKEENRKLWIMPFAYSYYDPIDVDNIKKYSKFLTMRPNGGTNYDDVLSKAIDFVNALPDQEKGLPDIVMLTDGQCRAEQTEKINELKEKKKVKFLMYMLSSSEEAVAARKEEGVFQEVYVLEPLNTGKEDYASLVVSRVLSIY